MRTTKLCCWTTLLANRDRGFRIIKQTAASDSKHPFPICRAAEHKQRQEKYRFSDKVQQWICYFCADAATKWFSSGFNQEATGSYRWKNPHCPGFCRRRLIKKHNICLKVTASHRSSLNMPNYPQQSHFIGLYPRNASHSMSQSHLLSPLKAQMLQTLLGFANWSDHIKGLAKKRGQFSERNPRGSFLLQNRHRQISHSFSFSRQQLTTREPSHWKVCVSLKFFSFSNQSVNRAKYQTRVFLFSGQCNSLEWCVQCEDAPTEQNASLVARCLLSTAQRHTFADKTIKAMKMQSVGPMWRSEKNLSSLESPWRTSGGLCPILKLWRKGVGPFYKIQPRLDIFFIHSFSVKSWEDLGTVSLLLESIQKGAFRPVPQQSQIWRVPSIPKSISRLFLPSAISSRKVAHVTGDDGKSISVNISSHFKFRREFLAWTKKVISTRERPC